MTKTSVLPLALAAALLAGCGDKSQPPLEITTRAGGKFLVARPYINYLRICHQGEYSVRGDPDKRGLRVRTDANGAREVQGIKVVPGAGDATSEVVAWPDIAEINFGETVGDLGTGFCEKMPDAISATIRYADGHQDHRLLIDTTDQGLEGIGERGWTTIALRNVARLRVIDDQNWGWVKAYKTDPLERDRARQALMLKVTTDDGSVIDFRSAAFLEQHEKVSGNRTLMLGSTDSWDFTAFVAGATVDFAWPDLKSVEMIDPGKLTARITYADGRSETVTVAVGALQTTFDGGHSVETAHIKRIDVLGAGS
jgi:hypothetical protein